MAKNDEQNKHLGHRSVRFDDFPATSRRQIALADMLAKKGKPRKAPKSTAPTRRMKVQAAKASARAGHSY